MQVHVRSVLLLAAALAVPLVATAKVDELGPPKSTTTNRLYIVRMADSPVVAYTGGLPGLQATKPAKAQKIDPFSPAVVNYVAYLDSRHSAAVAATGGRKVYDYRYSFNGFAAELTAVQAEKMKAIAGVLSVDKDVIQYADTSSTPSFLGLNATGGLWDQLGGTASAGDGIIIGIIDSGVWPEHPSFSDRTGLNGNASKDGKLSFQQIPGWHGRCVPGEAWTAANCNQKLIGAQYFAESWGGCAGVKAQQNPYEFCSARDYNGHGTHTTSTSGGDFGVQSTGAASVFGPINGMAPHARVAMYKALWSTEAGDTASGNTSDLVAAIDQAVADGVDVINYSISGTSTNFRDPAEISFLYAANAGIFVAASAGNSGPKAATVAHPSPWITTVAAGTHNRSTYTTLTAGAHTYTGASTAPRAVTAPTINSVDAAAAGASETAADLCYSKATNGGAPALDPAKVAGKIVVCTRGANARVDKSLAVKEAGGVGMVLVNPNSNSLNADFHSVPTVHLPDTDRAAVVAYATTGATATIAKVTIDYGALAPYTASFSSRGPLQASGNLLKPDVIAPGQDILAGVSPVTSGLPGLFNLYSGTSMSSPHVAGLAALLKDLHPDWSPMMIKSALMTTAYDVLDAPGPTDKAVLFSQGAGHVRPNKAADPGLVFDSGWNDWLGFLCGTQLPTSFCTGSGIPVLNPSNFNSPSIAIEALAGSQTVTRTVTNVGSKATYTVSKVGFAGLAVEVSPATFTLNPGQTQKLQITITQATAPLNEYTGGQITWTDGTHSVRIPVVVKPVALAAPLEVSGSYSVKFGYGGPFTATPRGLVPATVFDGSVNTGKQVAYQFVVPAGTTLARFALFDSTTSPASDLDLYVYLGKTEVGMSGGGTAQEQVDLVNPEAGTYTIVVDGYATGNPTTFKLFAWALGSTDVGNMSVSAPETAVLGQTGTIGLSFNGLATGTKYLGSVVYGGAEGMPDPTIVRVDP